MNVHNITKVIQVGRIMAPKDAHILVLWTHNYVNLHTKGVYRCSYSELKMGRLSWIILGVGRGLL